MDSLPVRRARRIRSLPTTPPSRLREVGGRLCINVHVRVPNTTGPQT